MTIYGDGTIKMPDGSMITPRNPYDPTLVYKKDENAHQKYMDLYYKQLNKSQSNPAFRKALKEHQQKDNGF